MRRRVFSIRSLLILYILCLSTYLVVLQINTQLRQSDQSEGINEKGNFFGSALRTVAHSLLGRPVKYRRWYLSNTSVFVEADNPRDLQRLWPEEDPSSDRIENQLLFAQSADTAFNNSEARSIAAYQEAGYKVIYLPAGFRRWDIQAGHVNFDHCPVKRCAVVDNGMNSDAVVFRESISASLKVR